MLGVTTVDTRADLSPAKKHADQMLIICVFGVIL